MIFLQRNGLILGVSKIIIIGKLIYLCIESKLYPNSLFYAVVLVSQSKKLYAAFQTIHSGRSGAIHLSNILAGVCRCEI